MQRDVMLPSHRTRRTQRMHREPRKENHQELSPSVHLLEHIVGVGCVFTSARASVNITGQVLPNHAS